MIPRRTRRTRLKWDEARGVHVLLYPEGLLVLTPEAADILARVDGVTPIDALVDALALEHPEVSRAVLDRDVRDLLARLAHRGFIAMEEG